MDENKHINNNSDAVDQVEQNELQADYVAYENAISSDSNITKVSSSKNNGNKKYIILIVVFSVIIVAVIAALVLIWNNRNKNNINDDNNQANSSSDTLESNSDGSGSDIDNNNVVSQNTTAPSDTPTVSGEPKDITAFLTGNCYMLFTTSADTSKPMELVRSGSNYQVSMSMDGMDISALFLDGKFYMIDKQNSRYVEFTDSLMSMMGLDASVFAEATEDMDMSGIEFTSKEKEETDDDDIVCYNYISDTQTLKFYLENDNLILVEIMDTNGNITEKITMVEFSADIPANMLTVKGLKKADILTFFSGMMQ